MRMIKEDGDMTVFNLCEDLGQHSHALRALGVLLKGANLCEFADSALDTLNPGDSIDGYAVRLRWGLSQLIDMYLEKQNSILSKAVGFENDELDNLQRTEHALNLVGQSNDSIDTTVLYKRLERAVGNLDEVINGNGHFVEKAKKLKEQGISHLQMENERKLRALVKKSKKEA